MDRNELLFKLRSLELKLLGPEVSEWADQQSPEDKQKFVDLSLDLHVAIMKLTTAQLNDIADRLDQLSPDLETGIENLQGALDELDDTIKVINTLSTVIGLASRIVGLVL